MNRYDMHCESPDCSSSACQHWRSYFDRRRRLVIIGLVVAAIAFVVIWCIINLE